jgi:hypothetical protein
MNPTEKFDLKVTQASNGMPSSACPSAPDSAGFETNPENNQRSTKPTEQAGGKTPRETIKR